MFRVSKRIQQMREKLAENLLKQTQEIIEKKEQSKPAKTIKKEYRPKSASSRKRELGRQRGASRRQQTNIRKNTAKFNQSIKDQKVELEEQISSTFFRQFNRASSAPPEFSSSSLFKHKNQYQQNIYRRRSRSSITILENFKECIEMKKPELEMLVQKFDFDKAVKILRLRKEFREEQRLQHLKKALSKSSKFVEIPSKPVRFTIKILKPVNA